MDNWHHIIEKLKSSPNESDLRLILADIPRKKPPFVVVSALLTYTIPQTYSLLPVSLQNDIVCILLTYIGLSNLVSRLSLAAHIDTAKLWLGILSKVFQNHNLLLHLLQENAGEKLVVKELDKLLFKDKLPSTVNRICLKFSLENPVPNYNRWLCSSLFTLYEEVPVKTINVFLHSLLRSSPLNLPQYFELVLQQQHFGCFAKSYAEMKSFEQNDLALKLLTVHVNKVINSDSVLAWANVLKFIELRDLQQCQGIIGQMNKNLSILACLLVPESHKTSLITELLADWSDPKSTPISIQEYTTHFLVNLLSTAPRSFLSELVSKELFLTAISNHLEAFSVHVKSLGVILANKVCQFNNQPKIFTAEIDLQGYSYIMDEETISFEYQDEETCWKVINQPIVEEVPDQELSISQVNLTEIQHNKTSDAMIDSDDEEDDPMAHKAAIPKPLYIKDLLEYLNVDSKKERAYDMQLIALTTGPTLIRQKSINSNEVTFYSEDLIAVLIGLGNDFAISNFTELQLLNIIAVLVANPHAAIHMFKLLLSGDYSLQQRMIILSASSLACRELRGFQDDTVSSSFTKANFTSQELPPKLHNFYLQGVDAIEKSIQDDLMVERTERAKDELSGGKILRMSQKLRRTPIPVDKPKIAKFFKVVEQDFYFPLVSVWYESNGINIGHYSPVLIAHYIKTLTLILHTAYPSATNINDMIKEFLLIVTPTLSKIELDQVQVIESIVTGVLLICDVTDGQFLIDNFSNDLRAIQAWLSNNWESIIDERIVSLCSGLLLRLHELSDTYERSLMDQLNSFY